MPPINLDGIEESHRPYDETEKQVFLLRCGFGQADVEQASDDSKTSYYQ